MPTSCRTTTPISSRRYGPQVVRSRRISMRRFWVEWVGDAVQQRSTICSARRAGDRRDSIGWVRAKRDRAQRGWPPRPGDPQPVGDRAASSAASAAIEPLVVVDCRARMSLGSASAVRAAGRGTARTPGAVRSCSTVDRREQPRLEVSDRSMAASSSQVCCTSNASSRTASISASLVGKTRKIVPSATPAASAICRVLTSRPNAPATARSQRSGRLGARPAGGGWHGSCVPA